MMYLCSRHTLCRTFVTKTRKPTRVSSSFFRDRTFATSSKEWKELLEQVASGKVSPDAALKQISTAASNARVLESFANLDHSRQKRTGFPEAVFAQGKTPEQVGAILDDMSRNADPESTSAILATRVSSDMFGELESMRFSHGEIAYHETARILSIKPHNLKLQPNSPLVEKTSRIVVATAGTTDLFVAEEAAVTLEATGTVEVDRICDVGVAGLHRVLRALPRLEQADCVIVCAGMDGALPSVVGGLVKVPVIATPTSIGYGASFGGVSGLLTMLNSCSPGVGVVNIDNGFGAAALAYKIVQGRTGKPGTLK